MNTDPASLRTPPPKTNGLALTSLILGIVSVLTCGLGFIFSIPGVICGIMGMKRVKNSGGAEKGHGLAVAGVVMCAVSLVLLPIVGLLAAIAIPNFVKAREASMRAACVANLRMIDGAKATWSLENKKEMTDTPTDADLFGADKYIREKPVCPKGGIYTINPVNTKPACTVPGHEW